MRTVAGIAITVGLTGMILVLMHGLHTLRQQVLDERWKARRFFPGSLVHRLQRGDTREIMEEDDRGYGHHWRHRIDDGQ